MTNKGYGHQQVLFDEFAQRKGRNSRYSMRSFSRDLGISLTALSSVLSQKRSLSRKNLLKVANKLHWSPETTRKLLEGSKSTRTSQKPEDAEYLMFQEDAFRLISDWYYLAILNLAKLPDSCASSEIIAARLGISVVEAENALQRLQRMGLLAIEDGKLKRTTRPLSISPGTPSSAIRKYHKSNLELAMQSIDRDDLAIREISSVTFAADVKLLPEAKDLILKFKRKVARLLEGPGSTEVYTLAIQLFPITREVKSK